MTLIADCTNCQSPLEAPVGLDDAAHLACPLCGAEFAANAVAVRELPQARVLSASAAAGAPLPAAINTARPAALRTSPRRRRRPAVVSTLIGVVGGGLLGITLGAYGLLWILGPEGDVLGLSKWLPDAMLPPPVRAPAN